MCFIGWTFLKLEGWIRDGGAVMVILYTTSAIVFKKKPRNDYKNSGHGN